MSSMFTVNSYGHGEQTLEDLGGQPLIPDTGWVQVPITNTTNFSIYGGVAASAPHVRKIGNQVWFRGALNNLIAGTVDAASTTADTLFTTLPTGFRPSVDWVSPTYVCQGSSTNRWALRIFDNGACYAHRYGPSTAAAGAWLPFAVTWLVD